MAGFDSLRDGNASLAAALGEIVFEVADKYSQVLIEMAVTGQRRERENLHHPASFLSEVDLELHAFYKNRLASVLPAFVYASEEAAPEILGGPQQSWPEILVLVDPLDTSELAVRGLVGHTHLFVYSLRKREPMVSVVGDLFHFVRLFYAFRDEAGADYAFLATRNGDRFPLQPSREERLNRALVTNYSMRAVERFQPLAQRQFLLTALSQPGPDGLSRGRIGLDFGSVGLCHVAAGFTDAMIEIAKGFKLWDLLPGQYVLRAAGGTIRSLAGQELPLRLDLRSLAEVADAMERRQRFVAAGSAGLAAALLDTLGGYREGSPDA